MRFFFFFVLFVMGWSSGAFANPGHFSGFKKAYPQFKNPSCKICHIAPPQLNPYGLDYQRNAYDFRAIEGLDSDGDVFTNLEEIESSTFPGDKSSHP